MFFLGLSLYFDPVTSVVKTLIIVEVLYQSNFVFLSHHRVSICYIYNRKVNLKNKSFVL